MSLSELISGHYAYASLEEADSYFVAQLNAEVWEDADPLDKRKALIQSTNIIDLLRFVGSKTASTQTNQFPRGGDSTVPTAVTRATCEIAKALLDGVDPEIIYENVSLAATSYASIRTNYKDRTEDYKVSGIPSVVAYRYLRPYIADPRQLNLL